jgi:hypothetical protein
MFEKEPEDWKEYLQPEDQQVLAEILNTTKRHKGAYCQAEDVKVAQLWCALVEMKKKLDELTKNQKILEEPFRAIVEVGEAEKRKAIERMLREIVRPTDESSEQATKKLVESLMKF